MFALLLLLTGCTPIVVAQSDTLELDLVTITPESPWRVDFQVTASAEAMDDLYGGDVMVFLQEASGNGVADATLTAAEETEQGELDLEWSRDLELRVLPWSWCLPDSDCTITGAAEASTSEEITFTPSISVAVLLETRSGAIPDGATVEVVLID